MINSFEVLYSSISPERLIYNIFKWIWNVYSKDVHHIWYAVLRKWIFFCFCLSRWLVLLLNFHFLSLHIAMANNRRPEPGPRPSTERPSAHRVGSSELQLLQLFFGRFSNILVLCAGTRMGPCVSGMHQVSVCVPCSSWAQLECSTQTPTPTITWIKAPKESGHRSERCVSLKSINLCCGKLTNVVWQTD